MRVARIVLFVSIPFLLCISLAAQQTATTVRRDTQAVTILAQCLSAMGNAQLPQSPAIAVSGTLTLSGEVPKTFLIFMTSRGNSQLKTVLTTHVGPRTTIINGGQGIIRYPDGKVRVLLDDNLFTAGIDHFPVLSFLSEYMRSDVSLEYVGPSVLDGAPVQIVAASLVSGKSKQETERMQSRTRTLFYVNSSNGFLAGIQRTHYSENSPEQSDVVETHFSNYSAFQGVMVPMHQQTYTGGHLLFDFTIDSVTFGVNLTDSDFALGQ